MPKLPTSLSFDEHHDDHDDRDHDDQDDDLHDFLLTFTTPLTQSSTFTFTFQSNYVYLTEVSFTVRWLQRSFA